MPRRTDSKTWEASILRMNEDRFFDIIHAYFGEIETPFNKHKLLEKLYSFLLNEDIRKKIVNALNYEDIEFLSCIYYLENASISTITETFDRPPSEIKKKLINLEERLLIYREKDSDEYTDVQYDINPFLLDDLLPFFGKSSFLPYDTLEKPLIVEPLLTPVFFSSFYSYISNNTDIFKKDGTCKKKVYDNLFAIFPSLKGNEIIIELIFFCFINLKLIKKRENEIIVVEEHWKKFASLSHFDKLIYLCIARFFYTTECTINPAEIFSELLNILKDGAWYDEDDVGRALFLIYKKHLNVAEPMSSEMNATLLYAFRPSWLYGNDSIEALVIAEKLGLLLRKNNLLAFNTYFRNIEEEEKPLLLSSTYEITLSQNARLGNLLSILPGTKAIKSQTFATFEFNRQTCEKLFQKEMTADAIIEKLQSVSKHSIPQNVIASVEQWYKSYNSISMYHGFVLCVDEKKRKFFAPSSPLSAIVKKEISEGVYLLVDSDIKEINKQLKKAGLDFIFFNQKDYRVDLNLSYSNLKKHVEVLESEGKKELLTKLKKHEKERLSQEAELIKKLEKKDLDEGVKEILLGRIKRKVILSEKQLESATIHRHVREIKAFDFLGKVKFLEEAKTQKYLLEVTTNDKKAVVGYVEGLWKNFNGNTVVRLDIDRLYTNDIKYFDVSQILKIKVVVQSIFS